MWLLKACCLALYLHTAFAINIQPVESLLPAMEQQLKVDTAWQTIVNQRLNALQHLHYDIISPDLLTQSFLKRVLDMLMMQEAELSNIELTIRAAQLKVELIQGKLQDLQRPQLEVRRHLPMMPEVEEAIQKQIQLLEIQQKRLRTLQSTRDMLIKTVVLTREWCKHLQSRIQPLAQAQHQATLNTLVDQLHHDQKHRLTQLQEVSKQVDGKEGVSNVMQIIDFLSSLSTITAEEKNNLIHLKLDIETSRDELHGLCDYLAHKPPLVRLNKLQKPLDTIFNRLQALEDLLKKKTDFLAGMIQLLLQKYDLLSVSERNQIRALQQCSFEYKKQIEQIQLLIQQVQVAQGQFTRQLHAYLRSRQNLPGLDIWAWVNILHQIKEMPMLFINRLLRLCKLVSGVAIQASWIQSMMVGLIVFVWIRVCLLLKRFTKIQYAIEKEQSDFTLSLFSFGVRILHNHTYRLTLCLMCWTLLLVWKIPLSAFSWLLSLVVTHLVFSVLIHTAHFCFMSSFIIEEKQAANKKLYYLFYWILNIGQAITLFSLLVHQLIIDYEVRNLVARLFMLFLFIIGLVLLRIWVLVPKLLEMYWSAKSRYLKQVIRWLSFLLPIALLLNAILGLIGYVQLAWSIVGYQSIFLLAFSIYPFIKGLLSELFNWLSEQSIRHLRNGWLWSEALLKPLYHVLNLFTFILIIILLFSFVGWQEELLRWGAYTARWFNQPLVTILDVSVDTWKIIQVAMMSIFVAWLSKWSKAFAYRSIFANVEDLGLRNSLSTFIEYMAIFLSILATLQMVGITLSVLKYVLSGFAIGLSFGLRDLLNNFVTGILLLLERPLKVGDWVTVGEYEGQVINIGARSITVHTEDNRELMVPNADFFYKHFINWTRHDSIVRITIPLLIHRQDDPFKIRELILEVIANIKRILNTPSPEVYFKSTNRILLSFKIDYYVDLAQITSRTDVNSQFLFELWKRFKEEKITPPVVVQELHLTGQLGVDQLSQQYSAEGNAHTGLR